MNLLSRVHWWYTGEVAETTETMYDSVPDAIGFPVIMGLIAVGFAYTTLNAPIWLGVPAALLAFMSGLMTLVALHASYIYATERTETLAGVGL